jgi:hypothetical protein
VLKSANGRFEDIGLVTEGARAPVGAEATLSVNQRVIPYVSQIASDRQPREYPGSESERQRRQVCIRPQRAGHGSFVLLEWYSPGVARIGESELSVR